MRHRPLFHAIAAAFTGATMLLAACGGADPTTIPTATAGVNRVPNGTATAVAAANRPATATAPIGPQGIAPTGNDLPTAAATNVQPTATAPAQSAVAAAPTATPSATTRPATAATTPGITTIAAAATRTVAPTPRPNNTAAPTPNPALRAAPAAPTGSPEPHQVPGGTLMLPSGFDVNIYATKLGGARFMAVRPTDGMLFVADANGRILILPDDNNDGVADRTQVFASNLNQPSSIAFYQDWVYVGETNEVVRFPAPNNAMTAQGNKEVVVGNLPTGGHWTRTVVFGPDGKLYVSVGSSCNLCEEKDPRRAAINVYDPDGTNGRLYATGLRNAVGVAFQPGTGQMWVTVNGRDSIGDDIPPDDLRTVSDGTFYGWPYCYNGPTPNPEYKDAARCADVPPDSVALQAHSAVLGIAFGDQFAAPQQYKDSIYLAFHGSWNRTVKTGYKVVRVPLVNGVPGTPEDFAFGWLPGNADDPGKVWGRPVGVTIGKDGALYITDDSTGTLYRITAKGQ